MLMMTSIDDLRPSSSPFKWATEITDNSVIFNCTLVNFLLVSYQSGLITFVIGLRNQITLVQSYYYRDKLFRMFLNLCLIGFHPSVESS